MSKSLKNLVFIVLFLAPSSSFGMNPQVKIQTSDEAKFDIELQVAKTSEALKNMIEDIGEEAEQSIPLPEISKKQFELLLPAMQELAKLSMAELKVSQAALARQLQQIATDLKSNNQPLNNQQLIEFISGANYLDLPILVPALKALARRILNKDDWTQLEPLGDMLTNLWAVHPAKKLMVEGLSFVHPNVVGVIESLDRKKLISWSMDEGTIQLQDKNNLNAKPITLEHPDVDGVIEGSSSKNIISWSDYDIKIWDSYLDQPYTFKILGCKGVIECSQDKNLIIWLWDSIVQLNRNDFTRLTTLPHSEVDEVIESFDSENFISWSYDKGTIKIWDRNHLDTKPIALKDRWVVGVIESLNGKYFISWSRRKDTIYLWDKNKLNEKPIIIRHRNVSGVISGSDGKSFISWGADVIKLWDENNLGTNPICLKHPGLSSVMESSDQKLISASWIDQNILIWNINNLDAQPIPLEHPRLTDTMRCSNGKMLISWSEYSGEIHLWDLAVLDPTPQQILLLLAVYFVTEGNQKFVLLNEELAGFKLVFDELSSSTQNLLEKQSPKLIAEIKGFS